MFSSRFWVSSISVLALVLSGCGALLGVDFDDAKASDGGAQPNPARVGAEADAAPCARDDAADCARRCGRLAGRCGDVVACGGCSTAETCGGGGANRCGAGVCTPDCTGKRCGAPDGCDGVCTTGTCGQTPPGACGHAGACTASVRDLGELDGDVVNTPPIALSAVGTTSQWLGFRLREGSAGLFPADLRARLTLTFPAGSLWEMYVYYDRAVPDAFDCVTTTGSATGNISGQPLSVEWPDRTGLDDSANVTVEIRYASGTCGPTSSWNLRIEGDAL